MSVIDDRLNQLQQPEREALEHIRQLVLDLVPDAQEVISYNMPGFKYKGKYLLTFEAFNDHLSLFPGATVDFFKERLTGYKLSKGTIQFTVDKPLPDDIIKDIVRKRVAEIDG
jgi:uncharacterized protein YdhG (YjbR/CyaY superfamily)